MNTHNQATQPPGPSDRLWGLNLLRTMLKTKDIYVDERVNMLVMRDTPDVIRAAAPRARAGIEAVQGKDPAAWSWGKVHTLRFVSPLRRNGAGQELVGGFTVPRSGSAST